MNKVIMMGRLTADPVIRYTADQKPVANFRLAIDRRYKDKDTADFFECSAFGKTAESIEKYIKKGTKILIDGSLQTGSYTNRDGQKVNTVTVLVNTWEFAESKKEQKPEEYDFSFVPDVDSEELPFNL